MHTISNAGLNEWEFYRALGELEIPINDGVEDFEEDMQAARKLGLLYSDTGMKSTLHLTLALSRGEGERRFPFRDHFRVLARLGYSNLPEQWD